MAGGIRARMAVGRPCDMSPFCQPDDHGATPIGHDCALHLGRCAKQRPKMCPSSRATQRRRVVDARLREYLHRAPPAGDAHLGRLARFNSWVLHRDTRRGPPGRASCLFDRTRTARASTFDHLPGTRTGASSDRPMRDADDPRAPTRTSVPTPRRARTRGRTFLVPAIPGPVLPAGLVVALLFYWISSTWSERPTNVTPGHRRSPR